MIRALAVCALLGILGACATPQPTAPSAAEYDPHSARVVLGRHLALLAEAEAREPAHVITRGGARFSLLADLSTGVVELWDMAGDRPRLLHEGRALNRPRLPEGIETAVGRLTVLESARVSVRWESAGTRGWPGHLGDLVHYPEAAPTRGGVAFESGQFRSLRLALRGLGGAPVDVTFHRRAEHWAAARAREEQRNGVLRANIDIDHPLQEE